MPNGTTDAGNTQNTTALETLDFAQEFSAQINCRTETSVAMATSYIQYSIADNGQANGLIIGVTKDGSDAAHVALTVYAFSGADFDIISTDTIAFSDNFWHSFYLKSNAGNWELYVDGSILATVPITADLTGLDIFPQVEAGASSVLMRMQGRYVNAAQPPHAIVPAAQSHA